MPGHHTAPNSTHFAFQSQHVWNCNVPHQSHHITWNHSTSAHHSTSRPHSTMHTLHIPLSHSTHSQPSFRITPPCLIVSNYSTSTFHIYHSTPPYSTCTTPFHIASPHFTDMTSLMKHNAFYIAPYSTSPGSRIRMNKAQHPTSGIPYISHHTGKLHWPRHAM